MNTFIEQLIEYKKNLIELFSDFFSNYTEIKYTGSDPDFFGVSDYEWVKLRPEGKQLQKKIFDEFNKFIAFIKILMQELPENELELNEAIDKIHRYILQDEQIWAESTQEVLDETIHQLNSLIEVIDKYYSDSEECIFVPDTNALLTNPSLEQWAFSDIEKFTLYLTPPVLAELDKLKILYHKKAVQEKAESIIRRIKEYRRRGSLSDGVNLIKDKSKIKSVAVEPNFSKTLPWLDPGNTDDRFIAVVFEIIKINPKSTVTLVSTDINLQNKAEFAILPFVEPPPQSNNS